jgi:hypothetical protein
MTCLRIVNETECDVILRRAQALRGTLRKPRTTFAVGRSLRRRTALAIPSAASELRTDVRSFMAAIAAVQDDMRETKDRNIP